jgi:hypothetical protein
MPAVRQTGARAGFFRARRQVNVQVTRADGLLTVAEAAQLAGVDEKTVRNWHTRGYWSDALGARVHMPVARREGRIMLLDEIEVCKAEYATRKRARRPDYTPAAA